MLPMSASVRRGPASGPSATSTLPATEQLPSAQPPSDRPSAGALPPGRPESTRALPASAQPGKGIVDAQPPDSTSGKAAGASRPAVQQADGDGPASQASPSPRTPLQRVQSSPMASPPASQAEAACPTSQRRRTDADDQPVPRASPAGKENRDDSQTPPSSQPQAAASQSQRVASAAGRPQLPAASGAVSQAHAEPKPEAADATEPQRSPAQGSRPPGQRASDSQATQPLEALPPSRPSPVTPDAPISGGDGAFHRGAQAEHRPADPLQLSATAPTLPKGLAGPARDAATADGPSAAPQGGLPPPSADDGMGPRDATAAPPKEHSPVKMVAGQQQRSLQHLPPQVNRFFAAFQPLPPPPGRTPAGGITVAAFNAIDPFPWRPSPLLTGRAGAALGSVPTAAAAVTISASVASAVPPSRPSVAERPAEVAAGSHGAAPDANAAAVILVSSDTTHSGTADSKTPSRRQQSTGSPSGGDDAGASAAGADEAAKAEEAPERELSGGDAGASGGEADEPAEREPTGNTQTQDGELPPALDAAAEAAEPHAAHGPSGAEAAEGHGGGAAPAACPTDEEVQVRLLSRNSLGFPNKQCFWTPGCAPNHVSILNCLYCRLCPLTGELNLCCKAVTIWQHSRQRDWHRTASFGSDEAKTCADLCRSWSWRRRSSAVPAGRRRQPRRSQRL